MGVNPLQRKQKEKSLPTYKIPIKTEPGDILPTWHSVLSLPFQISVSHSNKVA